MSGNELRRLQGHTKGVYSVVFSPSGEFFASGRRAIIILGSGDKTIRLWDNKSGNGLRQLMGHDETIFLLLFGYW